MRSNKKIVPVYKLDHTLKVKSEDAIWHMHEYGVDLKSNHIYLQGIDRGYEVVEGTEEPGVDYVMANKFIKNMNLCMRANPDIPIVIHMKTCGGDWNEGMAIYDTIKSCPSHVTILNYTHARSMSSIILQAADLRVMMPHSTFMFHMGDSGFSGTAKQVESNVKFYSKTTGQMLDIYSERMKEKGSMSSKSIPQIKRWLKEQMNLKEDVYYMAPEAVELGFADMVFNYDWSSLTKYPDE